MYKKLMMIFSVFALLLFAACEPADQEFPEQQQDNIPEGDPFIQGEQAGQQVNDDLPEVVASLDGNEIRREEVSQILSQMQSSGQPATAEDAVNQIAINMVLEDEAQNRGIEPDVSLIEDLLRNNLDQQGVTEEMLEQQGTTFEDLVAEQEAMMSQSDLLIIGLIEDEKETQDLEDFEAEQSLVQLANLKLSEADFELFIESEPAQQEVIIEDTEVFE